MPSTLIDGSDWTYPSDKAAYMQLVTAKVEQLLTTVYDNVVVSSVSSSTAEAIISETGYQADGTADHCSVITADDIQVLLSYFVFDADSEELLVACYRTGSSKWRKGWSQGDGDLDGYQDFGLEDINISSPDLYIGTFLKNGNGSFSTAVSLIEVDEQEFFLSFNNSNGIEDGYCFPLEKGVSLEDLTVNYDAPDIAKEIAIGSGVFSTFGFIPLGFGTGSYNTMIRKYQYTPSRVLIRATNDAGVEDEVESYSLTTELTLSLTGYTAESAIVDLPNDDASCFATVWSDGAIEATRLSCGSTSPNVSIKPELSYTVKCEKEGYETWITSGTAPSAGETVDIEPVWQVEGTTGVKDITVTAEDVDGNLIGGVKAYLDSGLSLPFLDTEILRGLTRTPLGELPVTVSITEDTQLSFYKEGWSYKDLDYDSLNDGDTVNCFDQVDSSIGKSVSRPSINFINTSDINLSSFVTYGYTHDIELGTNWPVSYELYADPDAFYTDGFKVQRSTDGKYGFFSLNPDDVVGGTTIDLADILPHLEWRDDSSNPSWLSQLVGDYTGLDDSVLSGDLFKKLAIVGVGGAAVIALFSALS